MIYIIISNIGLALITIVMYIRYSHFRVSSSLKIKDLERELKSQKDEKQKIEEKLRQELKGETEQVKEVLKELDKVKMQRQEESKLRIKAEKDIELAMQKMKDVENRVQSWKVVQGDALKSSKNAIFEMSEELSQKIVQNNKKENDESRHFIEENMRSLQKHIDLVENKIEELKKNNFAPIQNYDNSNNVNLQNNSPDKKNEVVSNNSQIQNIKIDDVAKKALEDVNSLILASGLVHLKDYILALKIDANRAKFMFCDLVLIKEKTAYFIDFKADRYFKDFENFKEKDKKTALLNFQQKIDKYLSYISDAKYKSSIEKVVASFKMSYSNVKIIFAVRNRDDLKLMKDLKYFEKTAQFSIEILDVNGVNDLIL